MACLDLEDQPIGIPMKSLRSWQGEAKEERGILYWNNVSLDDAVI
jgi:hypothetical protein